MDEKERDIINVLIQSEGMRLRWKDLAKQTHDIYQKNTIINPKMDFASFKVVLNRKLNHLVEQKIIQKKSRSHQNVTYFISANKKSAILDSLYNDITNQLQDLATITKKLADNGEKVFEYFSTKDKEIANKCFNSDKSFDERSKEWMKTSAELYETYLFQTCKNLHRIHGYVGHCKVDGEFATIIQPNQVYAMNSKVVDIFIRAFWPMNVDLSDDSLKQLEEGLNEVITQKMGFPVISKAK